MDNLKSQIPNPKSERIGQRYLRQILFKEIGESGQEVIKNSKVVIIGCGALGTVSANNLTRIGVGKIRIIDRDYVDWTNLGTQVLFNETDARQRIPKAIAAFNKLKEINSEIVIEPVVGDYNSQNCEELVKGFDLIVDGTDNLETRFLMNTVAIKNSIPWIYSACVGSQGFLMNIIPKKTPCLKCLFQSQPVPGTLMTCETEGVLNAVPGVLGAIQSSEAIKIILGKKAIEGLLTMNLWTDEFLTLKVKKNKECPICVKGDFSQVFSSQKVESVITLCGRNGFHISPGVNKRFDVPLKQLAERLKPLAEVSNNGYLISFQVEGYEITVFKDGRAIIKGAKDKNEVRSLYARYIGL